MNNETKLCRKCLNTFPATLAFFYKNSGGKYGLTPRCKTCVNQDNIASHKARKSREPEKIRAQGNARAKKYYENNLEKARKAARNSAAKARLDPIKKAKIGARKRANGMGLSPEEIEAIREKQSNQCAICLSPNPTDLDHCHKRNKVRFLLCNHCNRGLGAFRDNPEWLKKAATLLENFNDTQ